VQRQLDRLLLDRLRQPLALLPAGLQLRLLGQRRAARLRRSERRHRSILRQPPEPNNDRHVDAVLPDSVCLRQLLRCDIQEELPLLFWGKLPPLATIAIEIF
jgi:hypothetical protein